MPANPLPNNRLTNREILGNPLGGGKSSIDYVEFIGKDGSGGPTFSFSQDSSQCSVVIEVPWANLMNYGSADWVISDLLGYAYRVRRQNNEVQDRLARVLPWLCPYFPWFWCVSLTNIVGVKFKGKVTGTTGGVIPSYERARMTATFSTLPYRVISDEVLRVSYAGDESYRWVEKLKRVTAEYISIDKGYFKFTEGTPNHPRGVKFPLGTAKINVKVDLEWIWHNVPENFIFDDDGISANIDNGLGCVNLLPIWGYPAGTLLCLPPEFIPTTQPVDPALLGFKNQQDDAQPPRTWSIRFLFKYWNPPIGTGGASTRGHNTAIWVEDGLFYAIKSLGTPTNAEQPLFQPYNFLKFFEAVDL